MRNIHPGRVVVSESGKDRAPFVLLQVFTAARIPLAVVFSLLALFMPLGILRICLGLACLLFIELSDLLDGVIARRFHMTSPMGALLDPFADSLSRLIIFWSLAHLGLIWPIVPLVMACRDVIVAYMRIIIAFNGKSVAARRGGKIKALVQAVGGIIVWLSQVGPVDIRSLIGTVLSLAVIVATSYSLFDYVKAGYRAAKTGNMGKA